MTESKFFDDYINQRVYTGGCKLTREFLEWYKKNYEFCGYTSVDELRRNLSEIVNHLPGKTKLVLMLGVEYPCESNTNSAFAHSHEVFSQHNAMVRELAKENNRITYIYYGDYLNGQDGFYKNNYHFTPVVYYKIASDICKIINGRDCDGGLNTVSKKGIARAELYNKIRENRIVDIGVKFIKKF